MSLITLTPTTPKGEPPPDPLNKAFYLPRLPREYYQADAVVHWTLTIASYEKSSIPPPGIPRLARLAPHRPGTRHLAHAGRHRRNIGWIAVARYITTVD